MPYTPMIYFHVPVEHSASAYTGVNVQNVMNILHVHVHVNAVLIQREICNLALSVAKFLQLITPHGSCAEREASTDTD